MKREEILEKGEIKIEVKRSGIKQKLTFIIERENTPNGKVPFLKTEKFVDISELVKIAEEYQLPVKAKNGKIIPKGKMINDFVGL